MKTRIYGKLHQLSFPLLLATNVYLWEEENEFILIDCGLKSGAKAIAKYINQFSKPLTHIAITHAHDDHIGGLHRLHQAFPNAEIYIGSREKKLFETQSTKKWGFVLPYKTLKENDFIRSLNVIETPGHTSGSISFYDEAEGSLICGDFMHSSGGLTISGDTRLLFPFPDIATESLKESVVSAEKIKHKKINNMFCGHGKASSEFGEKFEKIIGRAELRSKEK